MYSKSQKGRIEGEIVVPGSKSHTIRAVLLAAMAEGTSVIRNPLTSDDCLSALKAAQSFGADVEEGEGFWRVKGLSGHIKTPENYVDTGNSGTTTYFVTGMATLCEGYTFITGDHQIRRRPIKPLIDGLNQLGAEVHITRPDSEAPPVVIHGPLKGGNVTFSGFSSQNVSAVLLSAPMALGETEIHVEAPLEKPYLQMTIDWMKRFGVSLLKNSGDYKYFAVAPNQKYKATDAVIPSDWSGVAFPLVCAVTTPSKAVISGVDFNDAQGDKAVVDHMIAMGAEIEKNVEGGYMTITGGKKLKGGIEINLNDTPDALPALSVAACYCDEDVKFTGLAHVRVKETDRVAVMEKELSKMGAVIETGSDYMIVKGKNALKGTVVDSHDDHRVAMALTIAGMFADGVTYVKDAECASVSFPGFYEAMNRMGAEIALLDEIDVK